jgi:hypothetical protein
LRIKTQLVASWFRAASDKRSAAVKSEERRYRLIYFVGDAVVGLYSDEIVVRTNP